MEQAAVALEAIGESIVFLDHFKGLPDPRQRGKITYPLGEVLLLCLLAVLGGAETFVDIARFGEKKIDLLRRFRPFRGQFCKQQRLDALPQAAHPHPPSSRHNAPGRRSRALRLTSRGSISHRGAAGHWSRRKNNSLSHPELRA